MLESRLWYNKIETKNVKVAKMMEFIKTYDQYPRKFNFGHFFSSIILPPFWTDSTFLLRNAFSSNLTMNLELFRNHGAIYGFEKKFKKYSGENINPLGVHGNMRGFIFEVNSLGLL